MKVVRVLVPLVVGAVGLYAFGRSWLRDLVDSYTSLVYGDDD